MSAVIQHLNCSGLINRNLHNFNLRFYVKRYGLIGWPVAHSLSPPMQNAGFKAAGIEAHYELVPVSPEEMPDKIPEMVNTFSGWNCTIPHKQHILEFLDSVDRTAEVLGSVNTVVNDNGFLKGFSTDGYGMEKSVEESFNQKIKGNSFLFIGAGGAARAVALYFALEGAAGIGILNRTRSKAISLADEISAISSKIKVQTGSTDDYSLDTENYNVVIQSTSLGLKAGDPSPFDVKKLMPSQCVVDMIYKKTPFLEGARNKGCKTADGSGMLLHQGVKAWEIWTGQKGPVNAMRRALKNAMNKGT